MWRSATLPVSFCTNRVMVLGCTVRSRRISRSRYIRPDTEPENEPCRAGCQTGTNPNLHPTHPQGYSAFPGKGSAVTLVDVVGRTDAVDFHGARIPSSAKRTPVSSVTETKSQAFSSCATSLARSCSPAVSSLEMPVCTANNRASCSLERP